MLKKFILILVLLLVFTITGCNKNEVCSNGEHIYQKWVIVNDSTCTTLGQKNLICDNCKEIITTAIIQYKDHVEQIVHGVEATCTKDGYTSSSICKECNISLVEATVIPQLGHDYEINEELSTDSLLVYKCIRCEDSYSKENTDSDLCTNGHSASSWITTLEPTCQSTGSAHTVCINCNVELSVKTLAKISHTEEVIQGTLATCQSTGLTDGKKCSSCNEILKAQEIIDILEHNYVITNTVPSTSNDDGYIEYTCSNCNDSYRKVLAATGNYDPESATIILLSQSYVNITNDNGGVLVNGSEITINLAGEYDIYGELINGNIVISLDDSSSCILNLRGVKITSDYTHPIYISSGDKVEISVKSETENYIYDKRTLSTTDAVGAAIYSLVDLEIKGKGILKVSSTYNNGIASTKDLEIKNLELEVNVPNNALKGNDSLTIESGTIKAISSSGDALKTENSDISSKGKQRGIITILDGYLELYAACDGIDAAYDCIIDGGTINIYTEKYSTYSGDVTVTQSSVMYLRISSRASGLSSISKYSAMFITEDNSTSWAKGMYISSNNKKYYKFDVPANAKYVKFFAYNSSQTENQNTNYAYASDQLTIPTTNDTYYVNSTSSSRLSGSWENYNSPSGGMGGPSGGGMGGPQEGNSNKAAYSCKGIKADNSITINGGTISVKSHDDGIHTNSDVLLENGSYGIATLVINGGNITVYSDDDGLHADSTLTVNAGNVIITNSYEGIEGNIIYFIGGTIQIKSSDDGINAKSTLNLTVVQYI